MTGLAHYTPEQEAHIKELYAAGLGAPEIARITGYSAKTKMSRFIMEQGLSRTASERFELQSRAMIGKRFGKLVTMQRRVRRSATSGDPITQWQCQCDCGNVCWVNHGELREGNTKSCGCLNHRSRYDSPHWRGCGKISGYILHRYRSNAADRGLDFQIDLKYMWELFISQNGQCALSGLSIHFPASGSRKGTASLDRIESSKGYLPGNVQWVHKWVNILKREMSNEQLFSIAKAIYITQRLDQRDLQVVDSVIASIKK